MTQALNAKRFILPAIAAVLVIIAAVAILLPQPASGLSGKVVGDAFVIDTQDMTDEVAFVTYDNGAGTANLMVVKVGGTISCNLDTCNSCNGSPVAYYQPLGQGSIACQNCGFDFDLDNLEAAQGGCSPMNIPYTVDGNLVSIATADLDASVPLFANITRPAA